MTWNLAPKTILDSLTFEWSTRIMTRGIFFGSSITGFNFPLKTNALSWSKSICFSYFHPLSPLHHEVSFQFHAVAMLIVCVHRKWSRGRLRAVYLILRVQEGSKSQHRCQNPRLRSFLSSLVFPNFDHRGGWGGGASVRQGAFTREERLIET